MKSRYRVRIDYENSRLIDQECEEEEDLLKKVYKDLKRKMG